MVERTLKYILLVALGATCLTGCSYLTSSGRQQMAYQRYVRKSSGQKMKLNKKIKAPKMPRTPPPSDNRVNSGVGDSPQSVRSGESETGN